MEHFIIFSRWPQRLAGFSRRHRRSLGALAMVFAFSLFLLSADMEGEPPLSPVLYAENGELLSAALASDQQWRFPLTEAVPEKFAQALIAYEDQRFYRHPGVDALALLRALANAVREGRFKSGASTLTMQLARILRGHEQANGQAPGLARKRGLLTKFSEMRLALSLDWRYSKPEILRRYAQYAPFGGNIVGLETASQRYFGRAARELSWAEATALAVLPNSPALIHPGRGRVSLQQKRDRLLRKLQANGLLSATDLRLAVLEPLPDPARPLPRLAPHLLDTLIAQRQVTPLRTTLDADSQRRLTAVVEREAARLQQKGISNTAVLVIDNHTLAVRAYIGNASPAFDASHGRALDLIRRPRSSGSILKPVLYALMLEQGLITPSMLVPDVPTQINGYVPENFDRQYRGAVRADEALALSLNVPAVRLLREYGVEHFHGALVRAGISTLFRTPDGYGLSLILGGAETTLWEVTQLYANLGRIAQGDDHYRPLVTLTAGAKPSASQALTSDYSPGAAFLTLNALQEVNRPGEEGYWRAFSSSRRVAWKTGTSFGLRDAWAVAVTPALTIGVWAGNAEGTGVAGLSGSTVAAPILFAVLNQLPDSGWFTPPLLHLRDINVCQDDGYLVTNACEATHEWLPAAAHFEKPSPHHRLLHTDANGRRVDSRCADISRMNARSWFVLPPTQEHFFRRMHADYRPLPAWRNDCTAAETDESSIGLLYPQEGSRIFIPVDLDGQRSQVVFQAVHRRRNARLYWHLDNDYLGQTQELHQWQITAAPGPHTLTLVDEQGSRLSRRFLVMGKGDRAAE